jgi:transcriptional regulator with XRE-family HTH domain
VKDLLVLLGKRVREVRAAKKWSQEEFAHISGLHRTYVGQIERGEKYLSFANLVKIADVLGLTMSELLLGLEEGGWSELERASETKKPANSAFEIHRLIKRLRLQNAAMDRTVELLESTALEGGKSTRQRKTRRRHQNSRAPPQACLTFRLLGTFRPKATSADLHRGCEYGRDESTRSQGAHAKPQESQTSSRHAFPVRPVRRI